MVRIFAPGLNKSIAKALKYRAKILKDGLSDKITIRESNHNKHPFGKDVKMAHHHKPKSKLLTPAEQDEVVLKYKRGMTMTAITDVTTL